MITVEPDLITLAIHSKGEGDRDRVLLHTAYNPPSESHSIREASAQLREVIKALNIGGTQILVGDFNLHHPIWGGRASKRHLLADKLIEAIKEAGLISLLSTGSVTKELVINKGISKERT